MNRTFTFLLALLVVSSVFAQSPEKLSYQAVVRDTEDRLLVNQAVGMQISILLGSVTGTPVYTETHIPTSNANGLVTIEIGSGSTSDDFTAIDWSNGTYFVKTETDPSGGTSYTITGTSQLLSVPYALHAKSAVGVTGTITESQISDLQPYLTSETDPTFAAWNRSTGISITESQVSDLQSYLTAETDPTFAAWDRSTGISITESQVSDLQSYLTAETDPIFAASQANNISAADIVNLGNLSGTNTGDQNISWGTSGSNIYYNDGYVGIGTTNPGAGLALSSANGYGSAIGLLNTGANLEWRLSTWTDGTFRLVKVTGSTFTALTAEQVNGYIGIGTSAPAQKLHIKQNMINRGIRIEHQSNTNYWENGIGTTTLNYKFYFNGLFRADISSVDGAYVQSSDRRLKRDIQNMGSVLDKVMRLKPTTYHYKNNDASSPRSKGFVTQDVEDVFPDLVREIGDGYSGIVYDGFAVISIKAIQEMNIEMKVMQSKTDQMEAEIVELKRAIETLKRGNLLNTR